MLRHIKASTQYRHCVACMHCEQSLCYYESDLFVTMFLMFGSVSIRFFFFPLGIQREEDGDVLHTHVITLILQDGIRLWSNSHLWFMARESICSSRASQTQSQSTIYSLFNCIIVPWLFQFKWHVFDLYVKCVELACSFFQKVNNQAMSS